MTVHIQNNPYTPFRTIRKICADAKLWTSLLQKASEDSYGKEKTKYIVTSCIANLKLLSVLFVGKKLTHEIMDPLHFDINVYPIRPFQIQGEFVQCALFGVVSGEAILEQNKYVENKRYHFDTQKAEQTSRLLAIKFMDEVASATAEQDYTALHAFNGKVINQLEADLDLNAAQVSRRCSFIYHVCINEPCKRKIALRGTVEELKDTSTKFNHAFILEQYYSRSTQSVFVRLHQSWIGLMTLPEYYEKMQYGAHDEGCFNNERLAEFFKNFRSLFLCEKNMTDISTLKLGEFQSACFNIPLEQKHPPGIFRTDEGIFCGTTVRYVTNKIRPKDCLKNLQQLLAIEELQSSSDLI